MPRKGRARRFREARELKQGYDDGLFREGSGTLADVDEGDDDDELDDDDDFDDEFDDDEDDWDPDHQQNVHVRSATAKDVSWTVGDARRRRRVRQCGGRAVGVDLVARDRLGDVFALARRPSARGRRAPRRTMWAASTSKWRRSAGAGVGEAVAVGAEHDERLRHEPGDLVGHRLHEVGDRDDRALGVAELLGDVRRARRLRPGAAGSTARLERVLAQQL